MVDRKYLEWCIDFRYDSILQRTLSKAEFKKLMLKTIDEYVEKLQGTEPEGDSININIPENKLREN